MIDVKDLRVGDYVYLQNSKTPYKITEVGYSEIEYPRYEASGISTESVFRTYVDNLNPIPISEELLLRCGFSEENDNFYRADLGNIVFNQYGYYIQLKECSSETIRVIKITSLHKLQNIYFALTGKELEVNL